MSTSTDTVARAALTKLLGRRTVFPTFGCALAIAGRRDFRAGSVCGRPTPLARQGIPSRGAQHGAGTGQLDA